MMHNNKHPQMRVISKRKIGAQLRMAVEVWGFLAVAIVMVGTASFAFRSNVNPASSKTLLEIVRMYSVLAPTIALRVLQSPTVNAYTVNKTLIYLPVDKVEGKKLRYMAIHELAHVITSDVDECTEYHCHSANFKENLLVLLNKARTVGYDV